MKRLKGKRRIARAEAAKRLLIVFMAMVLSVPLPPRMESHKPYQSPGFCG